jgi:hypothetical protein
MIPRQILHLEIDVNICHCICLNRAIFVQSGTTMAFSLNSGKVFVMGP